MGYSRTLSLAVALAMLGQPAFAFDPTEMPENRPAGGGSLDSAYHEHPPAEAINLAGGAPAPLTPELKANHNENMFGQGHMSTDHPAPGTSGLEQPRNADNLPRAPLVTADGEPVKGSDGKDKTRAIVPDGFFIQATPFRPNVNPAPEGSTRYQVTGRFTDFSPAAQKAITTKLEGLAAGGNAKAAEVLDAIKGGQGNSVFIDKGVMDVSDTKGGPVALVSLGNFGLANDHPSVDPIVVPGAKTPNSGPAGGNHLFQPGAQAVNPGQLGVAPQQPGAQAPSRIVGLTVTNPKTGQTSSIPLPAGLDIGIQRGQNGKIEVVPMPKGGDAGAGQQQVVPAPVRPDAAPAPQSNQSVPAPMPALPPGNGPAQHPEPSQITRIQIQDPATGQTRSIPVPDGAKLGLQRGADGSVQIVPMPAPGGRGAAPMPQLNAPGEVPMPAPGGRGAAPMPRAEQVVPAQGQALGAQAPAWGAGMISVPIPADAGIPRLSGQGLTTVVGGMPPALAIVPRIGGPNVPATEGSSPAMLVDRYSPQGGTSGTNVVLPPATVRAFNMNIPVVINVPPNTFVGQNAPAMLVIRKDDAGKPAFSLRDPLMPR